LENSLWIASSHIKADIDKLVKQKQCQISHSTQNISDVQELMFCKFSIMILLRNKNQYIFVVFISSYDRKNENIKIIYIYIYATRKPSD
jgi:hypothetical protein